MGLVQLAEQHVVALGVARGKKPVFELHLEDHQRVVAVLHSWEHNVARRKTVDHHATLLIESRL